MFAPITKCFIVLFLISNCNLFTGHIGTFAIKITKTHVLTEENYEPVILDCDYEAEHYNSTLVVKWMKGENLIYQWIKGYKPTVYTSSKGLINEEYETSENANYKYRAIEFPIPTKELSGNYKCSVQKINSTEIIQIDLHIIDVSRTNMQLHHKSLPNDTVVICEVESVFPTPRLSLWNDENNPLPRLSEKVELLEDGFFNATVMASVNELDENGGIQCTLQFSGIEYNFTKTFSVSKSSKNDLAFAIVLILIFVKFI